MKIHDLNPWRAACAATELARLPVEEHETVSKPKLRALASATATTRSLKLSVGKQTASFLTQSRLAPSSFPRWGALMSGVKPVGNEGRKSSGSGSSSA